MGAPANMADRPELARLFAEQSRLFTLQAENSAAISKALGGAPPAARASAKNGSAGRSTAAAPASGTVANDRALDAPNGNPIVKFTPRRWEGDSFNGCTYRDCSPEFLEVLAEALDWSAANPKVGKEQYAAENARCATLARAWARRIQGQAPAGEGGTPDDPGIDSSKESW